MNLLCASTAVFTRPIDESPCDSLAVCVPVERAGKMVRLGKVLRKNPYGR